MEGSIQTQDCTGNLSPYTETGRSSPASVVRRKKKKTGIRKAQAAERRREKHRLVASLILFVCLFVCLLFLNINISDMIFIGAVLTL